jgi:hypothetical protein
VLLHQSGGLTEAEFVLAKARVLAECPANADPPANQRDGSFADGGGVSGAQPTTWPHSAMVAVIVLVMVIAVLAAPILYRAFETWVFSRTKWTYIWE